MKWHYDVVSGFYNNYYSGLLTENMIDEGEIFIKDLKDSEGFDVEVSNFFYQLKKNNIRYLLESKYISELPILVKECEKVSYRGRGYNLIKKFSTAKFKPEKHFSFKELVGTLCDFKHTNNKDFTMWKLLVLSSYLGRVNVRVATTSSFGKDSVVNVLYHLLGDITKLHNPTIAKLEYSLYNKLININEVSGIKADDRDAIEHFLLSAGDFGNEYTKRSRAKESGKESFNISNLSILITYNTLEDYKNEDRYFDNMFANKVAINNRFLPFLFSGTIVEKFNDVYNLQEEIEHNKEFFIKFIRTINYYKQHLTQEQKGWVSKHNFEQYKLKERWLRSFTAIAKFIELYADNETEFNELVYNFYKSHLAYLNMFQQQNLPFYIMSEERLWNYTNLY